MTIIEALSRSFSTWLLYSCCFIRCKIILWSFYSQEIVLPKTKGKYLDVFIDLNLDHHCIIFRVL